MSRIPISRILAVTEYSGTRRATRVAEMMELAGQSGSSPLEKIEESTRIRVQQATKKGALDDIGLREYDFDVCYRRFFRALSVTWIALYAHWQYCGRTVQEDNHDSDSSTDDSGNQSAVEYHSDKTTDEKPKTRRFVAPTVFGWQTMTRPIAHFGPLLHPTVVSNI